MHGGWLPLAIAALIFTALTTWRKGREIVSANRDRGGGLVARLRRAARRAHRPSVHRVAGTAVFLNANPDTTPLALRANVEHNHVLHEHVVVISIETERVPHVPEAERLQQRRSRPRRRRHQWPDRTVRLPGCSRTSRRCCSWPGRSKLLERSVDLSEASYFLSQITIVRTDAPGMSAWRKRLFLAMAHNAASPVWYFRLPDDRTVTIGERVAL